MANSRQRVKVGLVAVALVAAMVTVVAVTPTASAGVFKAPWVDEAECDPHSIGAGCTVRVCWVWQGVQHCE